MNESLEFLVKKNMMMKMLIVQKMSANNLSRLLYIKESFVAFSREGKRTFIVSFKSLGGAWKKGDIIFSGTKRYV